MKRRTKVLTIVLVLLQLFPLQGAENCNTCSAINNLACVSVTEYQVCVNGAPTGSVNSCPANYVCSTTDAIICKPNAPGVVVPCSDCGKCDTSQTFACTGDSSYLLCLGTSVPSNLGGSCAPNLVCSINYPQICADPATGVSPSCPSPPPTPTPPTTPIPTNDAQYYCQQKQQAGRFPVGNAIIDTCKQYIYCFRSGGAWHGALYTCAANLLFDSASQLCDVPVPARCS